MSACATLPALPVAAAQTLAEPEVLLEGVPEPRLRLCWLERDWPLDRRRAEVEIVADAPEAAGLARRWAGAAAGVCLPLRLIDGQTRWLELVSGRLRLPGHQRDAGRLPRRQPLAEHQGREQRDENDRKLVDRCDL